MSLPYLSQDIRDQAEEARRQGTPVATIAERIGINVDDLCQLMSWPMWKTIPDDPETDLFALDRLEDVL